jgi:Transmembrane domain of unknown function (DUF3566)
VSSPSEPSDAGTGTGKDPAQQSAGLPRPASGPRLTDAAVVAAGSPEAAPPVTRVADPTAAAVRPADSAIPPWQRPGAHVKQPDPRASAEPRHAEVPARPEQRPLVANPVANPMANPPADLRPTVVSPVVPPNSRTSRYVTGTAAPAGPQAPKSAGSDQAPGARTEITRATEHASELPDLSGPPPRSPQHGDSTPASSANRAAGRIQVGPRPKAGPVRATMQIRRIDPWSALKVSLLLSVALFFVWMIAVAILYLVLGGMGVWSKLNSNVGDLLTTASGGSGELVSSGSIFGGALLIGLVNIVLLTALATIGAFVYNLTTDIVGGVEVTLADRD